MALTLCASCGSAPALGETWDGSSVNPLIGDEGYRQLYGKAPGPATPGDRRVAAHLWYVEQLLRAESTEHLSARERQARSQVLDDLRDYRRRGEFPRNIYTERMTPVFVDETGTLCAVGHLVNETLGPEAVLAINRAHQLDVIADMRVPWLESWAHERGLSLRELMMIQPSYAPAPTRLDLTAADFVDTLDDGELPSQLYACLDQPAFHDVSHINVLVRYHADQLELGLSTLVPNTPLISAWTASDSRRLASCLRTHLAHHSPPGGLLGKVFPIYLKRSGEHLSLKGGRLLGRMTFYLTIEEIQDAVQRQGAPEKLAACFSQEEQTPFDIAFSVDSRGKAGNVRVWLRHASERVESCVTTVANQFQFRAPPRETPVRVSFRFTEREGTMRAVPVQEADPLEVPDELTLTPVLSGLAAHSGSVAECLGTVVSKRPVNVPLHRGRLHVKLAFSPSGSVSAAQVLRGERMFRPSPAAAQCIEKRLQQLSLERHAEPALAIAIFEVAWQRVWQAAPIALHPLHGFELTSSAARLRAHLRFEDAEGYEFFVNEVPVGPAPNYAQVQAGVHRVLARGPLGELSAAVRVHPARIVAIRVQDGQLLARVLK